MPDRAQTARRPPRGERAVHGHPLRDALLALIERDGATTSTVAARELGESSGSCSFHLRRLAALGLIEEVPDTPGRTKPWRATSDDAAGTSRLNRELEDVAYASWLREREGLPAGQRHDFAFSEIADLSPRQIWELNARIRRVIDEVAAQTTTDDQRSGATAIVVRAFPMRDDGAC